ncbi:MAG: hypothetical protein AAF483_29845, partial [Planctomycetota bacterium]
QLDLPVELSERRAALEFLSKQELNIGTFRSTQVQAYLRRISQSLNARFSPYSLSRTFLKGSRQVIGIVTHMDLFLDYCGRADEYPEFGSHLFADFEHGTIGPLKLSQSVASYTFGPENVDLAEKLCLGPFAYYRINGDGTTSPNSFETLRDDNRNKMSAAFKRLNGLVNLTISNSVNPMITEAFPITSDRMVCSFYTSPFLLFALVAIWLVIGRPHLNAAAGYVLLIPVVSFIFFGLVLSVAKWFPVSVWHSRKIVVRKPRWLLQRTDAPKVKVVLHGDEELDRHKIISEPGEEFAAIFDARDTLLFWDGTEVRQPFKGVELSAAFGADGGDAAVSNGPLSRFSILEGPFRKLFDCTWARVEYDQATKRRNVGWYLMTDYTRFESLLGKHAPKVRKSTYVAFCELACIASFCVCVCLSAYVFWRSLNVIPPNPPKSRTQTVVEDKAEDEINANDQEVETSTTDKPSDEQ